MYSAEELDEKAITQELFDAAPDDQNKYDNKLGEMLDQQSDHSKYVEVTSLKIDEDTTATQIETFGRLCGTMSNLTFKIQYGVGISAVKPISIEERIAQLVSSEAWRRKQVNREEEKAMLELNQSVES